MVRDGVVRDAARRAAAPAGRRVARLLLGGATAALVATVAVGRAAGPDGGVARDPRAAESTTAAGPTAGSAKESAKVRLGRLMFEDTALSDPPGQSCASCHSPDAGFADPRRGTPTSPGARPGLFGDRNAPALSYMTSSPPLRFDADEAQWVGGLFWDGRASTLQEQAKMPFLNPVEMANADPARIVAVADEALYRAKDGGRNRVEAAPQRGAAPPASGREHRPPDHPPSPRAARRPGPE